ncbi:hypothetical protein BGZ83_003491, partial [Gryganskiella cystojenkinii]
MTEEKMEDHKMRSTAKFLRAGKEDDFVANVHSARQKKPKSPKEHTPTDVVDSDESTSEEDISHKEKPTNTRNKKQSKNAQKQESVPKIKKTSITEHKESSGEDSAPEHEQPTKETTKESDTETSDDDHTQDERMLDEDTPDEFGIYSSKKDRDLPALMFELAEKIRVVKNEIREYKNWGWKQGARYAKLLKFKEELLTKYRDCKKRHQKKYGTDEPTEQVFGHFKRTTWTHKKVLEEIGCYEHDSQESEEESASEVEESEDEESEDEESEVEKPVKKRDGKKVSTKKSKLSQPQRDIMRDKDSYKENPVMLEHVAA